MLEKVINYLKFFNYKRRFIKFNKKNFTNSEQHKNIILLEFNSNNLSIIANSFFSNFLKKKHQAQIVSYLFAFKTTPK